MQKRSNIDPGSTCASILLIVLCAAGCGWVGDRWNAAHPPQETPAEQPAETTAPPSGISLAFGNPSDARADAGDDRNYLLAGEGSTSSYNNERGTINWITWRTTRSDLGPSIKRPDFRPDPRLPFGFRRVLPSDYSGSGYDRGHMVPSADRFANINLNEEAFLMTNVVPQTSALNQFPWEKLESYARSQARKGFDVYTIAGVYGDKGRIRNKVTVPTNCWKITVFLPHGTSIDNIGGRTRVIAVDMPNKEGIENDGWQKYRTTIRSIEQKTGYDFFRTMPRELQDEIETTMEMRSAKP